MKNFQLYARILRLSLLSHPSISSAQTAYMDIIVREVVLPDATLVWC
jgi:hypothetical protein